MAVGHLANKLVVDRQTSAELAEEGGPSGVVRGEHQNPSAGCSELTDCRIVAGDHRIDVELRTASCRFPPA